MLALGRFLSALVAIGLVVWALSLFATPGPAEREATAPLDAPAENLPEEHAVAPEAPDARPGKPPPAQEPARPDDPERSPLLPPGSGGGGRPEPEGEAQDDD